MNRIKFKKMDFFEAFSLCSKNKKKKSYWHL